jgi:hypothetical protein
LAVQFMSVSRGTCVLFPIREPIAAFAR